MRGSLSEDFSLVKIIQLCCPWSVLSCWKRQLCIKAVVSLPSMSSGSCSGSSLAQARELKAGKRSWNWRLELSAIPALPVGWIWSVTNVQSSYTLLRGENNQSHLAEILESSSWAVENKQPFGHALQHRFVFKRMLKSTLSQLSLRLPRVCWIFIWIHAKRDSLPLRAQKELEKNVFCLPSTQAKVYADWCTLL